MHAKKQAYMVGFRSRLRQYYQTVKAGCPDVQLHAKVQGYAEAGFASGLTSKIELEQAIALVHDSVFGMTLAERRLEQARPGSDEAKWDYFDRPAWERYR